jgi:hypothetical protein
MNNCKNGLGECTQQYCILETCPNITEFKLTRLQERTFREFWDLIEIDSMLSLFDNPAPTLYLYDAGCFNSQQNKSTTNLNNSCKQ